MSITVRAPAKINLYLGVGPRRDDGFHDLATVYQAIGLYDDVTVSEAAHWSVAVQPLGDIDCSGVPLDGDNLAIRAGRLLADHHGIGKAAAIGIRKGIPVAGGLAGGSADAAATLVALDRLWDLQTSDEQLLSLAARLGSDVPFALVGGTARGAGRGELVTPVTDTGSWWWLVEPAEGGLSTPEVYAELDRIRPGTRLPQIPRRLLVALENGDHHALNMSLHNDLQEAAARMHPDIRRNLHAGAAIGANSIVSGSGPTVLHLCIDKDHAVSGRTLLGSVGHVLLHAPGPVAGAHVVEYEGGAV